METKANYVVIGLFTLAVIAGVFGFVYWFQNIGGTGERAFYRVQFDGSVSGLRTGATVMFNGIRVGEVTSLTLNPSKPKQVLANISIDKEVKVRPDTEVGLEFQGLTGIASLALTGGSPNLPALSGTKENPAILVASAAATQDVTQSARDVLRRLDEFLVDNQKSLKNAIQNIDTFTATLARNSDHIDSVLDKIDTFSAALARNSGRVDKIAEGLQNLTGGEDGKGGDINEAARSIKKLADHLDDRTAEITTNVNKLTAQASKQVDSLAADARRTLNNIDRTVTNLDKNPSRLLFGGSGSTPAPTGRKRQ
ncbi:MAG TPA: MlaD family protein [Pseudolabrys sp.]|nr:MlaD family protein [Pseudolabrys sp.]